MRLNAVASNLANAESVAEPVRRWKHLEAYTRDQMEEILVAKLIATSAKQIAMFLVILIAKPQGLFGGSRGQGEITPVAAVV